MEESSPIESDSRQTPKHEKHDRKNWKKRILASAMASAIGIGGLSQLYAEDILAVPRNSIDYVMDDCDTATYFSKVNVESAMSTTASNQYIGLRQELDSIASYKESENFSSKYEEWEIEYRKFIMDRARENGLTLIDPGPYLDSLESATTFDEIIDILNSYSNNLGLIFSVPQNSHLKDVFINPEPIDASKISIEKFKEGVEFTIFSLFYLPKELYDIANVKEVKLVNSTHPSTVGPYANMKADGISNVFTGIIYLNISVIESGEADILIHEIGHNIDYALCGASFMRDREFQSLNSSNFEYGQDVSGDSDVINSYGTTSVIEDKAIFYHAILSGLDADTLDKMSPQIQEKYRFLLERLTEKIPTLAQYLADISPRNPSTKKMLEK